ncbi:MAG: toxin-antitoxin system HicB family antitoxin [Acidimicrobiales bacterium]
MRISNVVAALRDDLVSVASLGDDATALVAERLADAMVRPVTATLLELLGQIAAEIDDRLPHGRVEVRLAGQDAELIYVDEPEGSVEEQGDDAAARITLRLPEQLKARVEQAAQREGVSVNSYIVRALSQRSRPSTPVVGRRLTGYGRG